MKRNAKPRVPNVYCNRPHRLRSPLDALDRLLAGQPIGRIVGVEAMKFDGWQRLNAEYAKQFGVETPGWPSRPRT